MEQITELENTFIEEYNAGNLLMTQNMSKSATIMFSKALFAVIDYLIFKKYSKLPKNHSERFRILELKETEIYLDLDKLWNNYTDSYTKPIDKLAIQEFKKLIIKIVMNHEEFTDKIKKVFEK
ncbi:MAG: hypothetical protein PHU51_03435 [Candidatus Nanoarchaeia archaeon]|nr:hypothetical protein [Candidatus Nanoarchaeia archaeon]